MTVSTAAAPADASTWAPLRRSAFRTLWIASFVSNIGTWMQTVGAQWLLVDQHSSSLVTSLVQSASSLPVLLLTIPAGLVAEFVDRRRMLIATQALQVAVGALLAAVTIAGHMTPTLLLVFTFLLGCGAAAQLPAYQAFVPDLVPLAELGQAAALSSIGVNLARAVGPAIAGLLVTRIGVGGLFALNAATLVVFALALLRTRSPARAPAARQAFLSGIEAGATCGTPPSSGASSRGSSCSRCLPMCCGRCWPRSRTTASGWAPPATACCWARPVSDPLPVCCCSPRALRGSPSSPE